MLSRQTLSLPDCEPRQSASLSLPTADLGHRDIAHVRVRAHARRAVAVWNDCRLVRALGIGHRRRHLFWPCRVQGTLSRARTSRAASYGRGHELRTTRKPSAGSGSTWTWRAPATEASPWLCRSASRGWITSPPCPIRASTASIEFVAGSPASGFGRDHRRGHDTLRDVFAALDPSWTRSSAKTSHASGPATGRRIWRSSDTQRSICSHAPNQPPV